MPDLSSHFNYYFPLPFRIELTIVFGLWSWAFILQLMTKYRIDVEHLLKYSYTTIPLYVVAYQMAVVFTVVYIATTVLYWMCSSIDGQKNFPGIELLPFVCYSSIPVVLLYPGIALHKSARYRFVRTLRRIALGGLDKEARFGDIIVADILTSYTKVIGDMWIVGCMCTSGQSILGNPDRKCGGRYFAPLLIALPYMIRLRQCLLDYFRSNLKDISHLMNALKYSTSFPVIVLSVLQASYSGSSEFFNESTLYNLWIVSLLVNSLYSYWWDVTKDWDLTLFRTKQNGVEDHKGLRAKLYFSRNFYYFAIFIDLILRLSWSVKLSPHLYFFNNEGGIFALEIFELIRRWVWLILRLETEWIRQGSHGKLPMYSERIEMHEAKD
ncbi:EXS family-domain-containing protein [Dipodascopsis uninucleata]